MHIDQYNKAFGVNFWIFWSTIIKQLFTYTCWKGGLPAVYGANHRKTSATTSIKCTHRALSLIRYFLSIIHVYDIRTTHPKKSIKLIVHSFLCQQNKTKYTHAKLMCFITLCMAPLVCCSKSFCGVSPHIFIMHLTGSHFCYLQVMCEGTFGARTHTHTHLQPCSLT